MSGLHGRLEDLEAHRARFARARLEVEGEERRALEGAEREWLRREEEMARAALTEGVPQVYIDLERPY